MAEIAPGVCAPEARRRRCPVQLRACSKRPTRDARQLLDQTHLRLAGASGCGGAAQEVPNKAWVNHTFLPYGQPNRSREDIAKHPYTRNQIWLYQAPQSLQDYCDVAQIVNYVQYRRAQRSPFPARAPGAVSRSLLM
jgi:hypothetical protein